MSEPIVMESTETPEIVPVVTPPPNNAASRRLLFWILMVGLVALDQFVKAWSRNAAEGVQGRTFVTPWPNIFELKLTYNEGIAFGWLQGHGVFLAPIAIAIAGGAIWYNYTHPNETRWAHASAALLAAGALGNLYDRVALHRVTDMFYFRAIDFPVFNVADACITVAACMLIISWIREAMVPQDPMPTPSETPAPAAE